MTAAQLQQAVASIYPSVTGPSSSTYTVVTDSSGNATISLWNNAQGAQPTAAQLTAAYNTALLNAAQATQLTTITASYNTNRYGAPVSVTSGTTTLTFPTDTLTQTNIIGLLVAYGLPNAQAAPAGGVPLKDASGNVQSLTVAQLQQLAGAIAAQSISAWQTYVSLEAQINAATTVAAVQAITWPTTT
jgi:hypothetical protein